MYKSRNLYSDKFCSICIMARIGESAYFNVVGNASFNCGIDNGCSYLNIFLLVITKKIQIYTGELISSSLLF